MSMPPPRTEQDLAAAVRTGEPGAFDTLFRRYYNPIRSLCLRMTGREDEAQDLAQETFMRALRSIGRLDAARPISHWLFKIASNLSIDAIRRRGREVVPPDADAEPVGPREPFATPDLDRLRDAILSLPATHRAVLLLNLQQDFSHEEIAETLGISVALSRVRLYRSLRMLREKVS